VGAVFVLYALAGIPAFLPGWPGDPSRLTQACGCQDSNLQAWFLQWTPFALLHGHNPFVTAWIEVPRGANLAVNTSTFLLGLLGAPLTLLAGGVATLSVWMFLAFPLSGTACFVLLRRWVAWTPAAVVGGLFYAFSPYVVAQAAGHVNLVVVPIPPLVALVLDELVVRQRRRAVPAGIALGLLGAAQYLISAEVFAGTVVVATVGVAFVALARPRQVAARWRHAAAGIAVGAALCAAIIAYPLWVQLGGPDRFAGSAHGTYPFQADLLGLVVPSLHQLIAPASALTMSNRFIVGNTTENGSYLGIPLLVGFVALVLWRWRRPLVRFAAAMVVAAELLSLGPTLTVNAHATGFPLPDRLFQHLPQWTSFLDARFALYADLFMAVLVAVGLAEIRQRLRAHGVPRLVAPALAAAAVLVPLLPAWPYASAATDVPALFGSAALAREVPAGSVALTYPYPTSTDARAMTWQARSAMRFRLMGGYALEPSPGGTASFDPYPPSLAQVPATLLADQQGVAPSVLLPGVSPATPTDVRQYVALYRVDTVVVEPVGAHPGRAVALLRSALGAPVREGAVLAWFHLQGRTPKP
jgi:hypothetical protein